MVPFADYAGLLTSLPTVEEVLNDHASELGRDLIAYRNHAYRVVNLCLAIVGDSRIELEKIAVAAVFHDLGIWTNHDDSSVVEAPALTPADGQVVTRRRCHPVCTRAAQASRSVCRRA